MDEYIARFAGWDWSPLGRRAFAWSFLTNLGLAATTILVVLLCWRFTKVRAIASCVVVAAWCAFYSTRRSVDEWRVQSQVTTLLPKLEEAGIHLDRQWPSKSGVIPSGIRFLVVPDRIPDLLMIRNRPSYPSREDIGSHITRGSDRIIRFDLSGAYDYKVEYHPQGTAPAPHRSVFGFELLSPVDATRLKENWYLVRYGSR